MQLRRYEISAAVRDHFVVASLDCAKAVSRLAEEKSTDGDLIVRYADAARMLLEMGELVDSPGVDVKQD